MEWWVMFEAKQAEDQPFTTLFTQEVFKEIIRFEKWLYFDLKYYQVPGIPKGENNYTQYPGQQLMYEQPPEFLTFYDLCEKEKIEITVWPDNVEISAHCRRNPEVCGIEKKVIK